MDLQAWQNEFIFNIYSYTYSSLELGTDGKRIDLLPIFN